MSVLIIQDDKNVFPTFLGDSLQVINIEYRYYNTLEQRIVSVMGYEGSFVSKVTLFIEPATSGDKHGIVREEIKSNLEISGMIIITITSQFHLFFCSFDKTLLGLGDGSVLNGLH